jgi:hypothetical protein
MLLASMLRAPPCKAHVKLRFISLVGRPVVVPLAQTQFAGIVCVEDVLTGSESKQDLLLSGFTGAMLGSNLA